MTLGFRTDSFVKLCALEAKCAKYKRRQEAILNLEVKDDVEGTYHERDTS